MPDKKSTPSKPAAQAAAARPQPAKKAPAKPAAKAKAPVKPAPAPKPAAKKAPEAKPVAAKKVETAKAAPPKAEAKKPAAAPKAPAKPAPAPKAQAKPAPEKAPAKAPKAKAAPKPVKAEAKPAKPEAKAETKAKPAPKAAKPAAPKPEAKPDKAEKPAKAKAEKPAKPPKAEKPPKLAPVAAALAKPIPAKPLAVAAGRAQPIIRTMAPPPRQAPRPLAAPKPVAEPETVGDSQPVPAFKGKTNGAAKGMVLVGAVGGAFGVKGEVRLRAFTDRPDGVISYGPLYGEDGKVLLRPKTWRAMRDGVAVTAPEIKTREEAEALKGQRLFVPRSNLPPTAEDEFYIVDLLGCRAEALDGAVLGEVVAVWNFGAGDIIEYRPSNGGPNVRVTFTRQTAPLVDLPGKRVVLDPPAPEPVGK